MAQIICGVDVSKAWLDAHVRIGQEAGQEAGAPAEGGAGRFANSPEGIAALAAWCRSRGAELVVMEASGGYERPAFLLLWEAGLACALVNPRAVRRFAESLSILEKTDRIDAQVIAHFAHTKGLKPSPPPSPGQQRLTALVRRLAQITADLTLQKQRRATTTEAVALESLEALIAFLTRQARTIEGEVAGLIDDDPLWAHLAEALRSIKGVAGRTLARLMADLPEIGTYSNKAVAKLVGLAPIANDSGQRQGPRHIRGGRAGLRSILFLVADIARRYDKDLADFHQRLTKAGKPKMVVRIALARKLLVRLNAKARDARAAYANAA